MWIRPRRGASRLHLAPGRPRQPAEGQERAVVPHCEGDAGGRPGGCHRQLRSVGSAVGAPVHGRARTSHSRGVGVTSPRAGPLVGRDDEMLRLQDALEDAARGAPSATLVHGEAGIGKTSLVRDLAERAQARGFHVVSGGCLRFGAEVTSYVPFSQALGQWLATADAETRARVFPGAHTMADLVPALARRHETNSGVVLFQIAEALQALWLDRPTLLIIDDVHWADPSSLDVLSYQIAGFPAKQPLALVITYRDTELGDGHPLHGWLTDSLRMPSVDQVALRGLDLWGTEQLVAQQMPGAIDAISAEQVHERSGGNPYLVELLISDRQSDDSDPTSYGAGLREALLSAWHRLSLPARTITQLLSVAGQPVAQSVLEDLAARRGFSADRLASALADAQEHGITVPVADGQVWFRHPLLAEVVVSTLRRRELADLHGQYAELWEWAEDVSERERANHLALHFTAAHERDSAFTWSLRAADEAAKVQATVEEAAHLARAAGLLPMLSQSHIKGVDRIELLTRAAYTAEAAGRSRAALEHLELALERVDRRTSPLLASRTLVFLDYLRNTVRPETIPPPFDTLLEALELTDGRPCEERVMALAELAWIEVFYGHMDAASDHAREAVDLAERVHSQRGLLRALAVRAQTRATADGLDDVVQALDMARTEGDPLLLARTALLVSNSYAELGRFAEAATACAEVYMFIRSQGCPGFAAPIGALACSWELMLGRLPEARPLVRGTLALRHTARWGMLARCNAALLAALDGDATSSDMHLRRASELMPNARPAVEGMVWSQVQCCIELGRPRRALELVESVMAEVVSSAPREADDYLLFASRAAADLSEPGQGVGDHRAEAISWLERIEALRGTEPEPFRQADPLDTGHPAQAALFAAERSRCQGKPGQSVHWERAARAAFAAGMRLDEARALYFLARNRLTERRGRQGAADALQRAHALALELGAAPRARLAEDLARQAHLPVTAMAQRTADVPGVGIHLVGGLHLTPRESEVLEHIVAGQTYGQIARELFISEKTVSVHVSSLLHKTGTTSRIQLAEIARRSAAPDS